MTPASTTPAFLGTGAPAGVVKGFDEEESALGLISGYAFSAPNEDVKLKTR